MAAQFKTLLMWVKGHICIFDSSEHWCDILLIIIRKNYVNIHINLMNLCENNANSNTSVFISAFSCL